MTALSDRVCSTYLTESMHRSYVYDFDPEFRAEFTKMRQHLDHVDAALAKAGDDELRRHDTLTALLAGPPDMQAALQRVHDRAVAVADAPEGSTNSRTQESVDPS